MPTSTKFYLFEETDDSYRFSGFNSRVFSLFGRKIRIAVAVLTGVGCSFYLYNQTPESEIVLFGAFGVFVLYLAVLFYIRRKIKVYLRIVKAAIKQGKTIKMSGKPRTPDYTVEVSK